jgi:hypothetical protein
MVQLWPLQHALSIMCSQLLPILPAAFPNVSTYGLRALPPTPPWTPRFYVSRTISSRWELSRFIFCPNNLRCCYITMHPETRSSENGIYLPQQMCHLMISFFQKDTTAKDENYQHDCTVFVMLWIILLPYDGKTCKSKFRFDLYAFQKLHRYATAPYLQCTVASAS